MAACSASLGLLGTWTSTVTSRSPVPRRSGTPRDLGAEHCLGERDGHDHCEVPTTAPEPGMGLDRHHHIEVAVRTAPASLSPALQSNALTVVYPGGDAHPDLAWPTFAP